MAKLKLSAEIVQDAGAFAIKFDIGGIPTQAQASEIGKCLDEAIRAYFAGKGATLTRDDRKSPGYKPPGDLILPMQ